jgi:competence protein ComEC
VRPPIIWLVVAFGAGLWAGLDAFLLWWWSALVGGAALVLSRQAPWPAAVACAAAAGVLWGGAARARTQATCAAQWTDGTRGVWLELDDPAPAAGGVVLATVRWNTCRGRVRVRWPEARARPGGARVLVGGRWRAARDRPGVLVVRHVGATLPDRGLKGTLRHGVSTRLQQLFGARASVAEALVTGRGTDLDSRLRERYVRSGLAHLLSISGLHVGFFAWWVGWFTRRLGAGPKWRALLPPICTAVYIWFLGWPAPATRAGALVVLEAIARHRERRVVPSALVALTVLAVLLVDPNAVHSVGAWLSVAAVSGLVWARPLAELGGAAGRLLAPSVGATVFTAPISAFAFGTVAPVGLFANLVAVPIGACVVPGLLATLVASLVSDGLASWLAAGTGVGLWAMDQVAALAAAIPGGHTATVPGWGSAVPWIAVLVLAVWAAEARRWAAARRIAASVALGAWLLAANAVVARDESGRLTVHFLAVGQGDAAVLRTPNGHWMVIDGGPLEMGSDAGRRVVVPFLRRRGVTELSLAVASHGDADHLGGLPAVIETFPPDVVLEPGQPLPRPLYLEFLADVEASGAEWRAGRKGDRFTLDGVTVEVLHPDSAWMARGLDANENSLVLRVTYGDVRFVFPGDAGILMEHTVTATVGRATVLKVGHHGSATATSDAWLAAMAPSVAIVSVGRNNRYGHPSPDVIARLDARGVRVLRTDAQGLITLSTDGFTLDLDTEHRAHADVRHHD